MTKPKTKPKEKPKPKNEPSEFQKTSIYLKKNYPVFWTGLYHHRTHKDKPLDFINAKYLVQIYQTDHPYKIIISSSQSGKSEYLIVNAIAKASRGRGVFYILPTEKLAYRFVRNRVDLSLSYTPYYQTLKGGPAGAESVSLKHIGPGVVAFAGAGSEASMVEFPADDYIVDELDRCESEANLTMALSRLDAAEDPQITKVSNPSFLDYRIDGEFKNTDQREWIRKCHCGHWEQPSFLKNLLRQVDTDQYVIRDVDFDPASGKDVNQICTKCNKPTDRYGIGDWDPTIDSSMRIGWRISKMFSSRKSHYNMIDMFNKGLLNPGTMQLFYNFDLGEGYDAPGAKITKADLDNCRVDYVLPPSSPGPCILGCDVGKVLNITIRQIMPNGKLRLVCAQTPTDPKDFVTLWKRYNVRVGVIDALPETRMVKKLQAVFPTLFRAYYGNPRHDMINKHKEVHIERTQTLDAVKEAIILNEFENPQGAEHIPEYYDQMTAAVRVFNEEKNRYDWREGSKADHYLHTEGYLLIAKKLLKLLK